MVGQKIANIVLSSGAEFYTAKNRSFISRIIIIIVKMLHQCHPCYIAYKIYMFNVIFSIISSNSSNNAHSKATIGNRATKMQKRSAERLN